MVCKECGAYNADNLTHCRVCAAKLKDTDSNAAQTAQEIGRPTRRFAQAPAWPKQAFTGAEESRVEAPASARTFAPKPEEFTAPASASAPKAEAAVRPAAPIAEERPVASAPRAEAVRRPAAPSIEERPVVSAPKAAAPAAPETRPAFCTQCGKQLFPDAPFCAYCGSPVGGAATPTPVSAPRAAAPKPVFTPEPEEEEPVVSSATRRFTKPAPAKPEKASRRDYDEDEDFDEEYDDDEYDDDLYDDDEDDDGGRRGGKGSNILFWVLIVVLVALIGGLGWLFVSKNGGLNNAIDKLFGGKDKPAVSDNNEPGNTDIGLNPADPIDDDTPRASIEPSTLSDGSEGFLIEVHAPNGSVLHLITNAALDADRVPISQDNALRVTVPKAVFMPEDYADTEIVSVTPQLELILPDSSTMMLPVPAVAVTLQPLTLTITEPTGLTVEQKPDNGPLDVKGTVDDHTVEVYINDNPVPVYEGGQFNAQITPDVDPDNGGEIVVTAKKKNRVTATQTITVTPYVVKDLALAVTTEAKDLRAGKDGAITIAGTVNTGATVTVTCDSDKVTCGTVSVTQTGTFACPITISEDGFYELTISGKLDGYNDSTIKNYVERVPESSNAFRKKCTDINKIYDKLVDGSTTSGNILFKGKIKEIVATMPYTIVKIELSNGKEVMLCNRSLKNTIAEDDIGRTKEIAGVYAGLYPDTELPYVWGWFIWNK